MYEEDMEQGNIFGTILKVVAPIACVAAGFGLGWKVHEKAVEAKQLEFISTCQEQLEQIEKEKEELMALMR